MKEIRLLEKEIEKKVKEIDKLCLKLERLRKENEAESLDYLVDKENDKECVKHLLKLVKNPEIYVGKINGWGNAVTPYDNKAIITITAKTKEEELLLKLLLSGDDRFESFNRDEDEEEPQYAAICQTNYKACYDF